MIPKLSEGALSRIISGEQFDKPIVQILGSKKIPSGNDKYRLLISDGISCHPFVMLGTQLNPRFLKGEFEKYTVICMDKYICNQLLPDRRVIVLLEATVIASGDDVRETIGNPTKTGTGASTNNNSNNSNHVAQQQPQANAHSNNLNNNMSVKTEYGNNASVKTEYGRPAQLGGRPNAFGAASGPDSAVPVNVHPISSLTPYQNRWTIRARVSSKSTIRTWSNSRGEGKLFSMDLLDASGEIRATAFTEQCDKFYDMIEVNKVYYISKCSLKTANKKFTSIKNDYEMTFNNETTVIPCNDDSTSIPMLQFDFVPISELQNIEKDSLVDVIGVCKRTSDIQNLVARTTNREIKKRDIYLVDKSNTEVTLTLWDAEAEKFDGSMNPIIAVKGAKVSDYGGKSLTASALQINPDIREAHMLRGWFDKEGCTAEVQSISVRAIGGMGGNTSWKTFAQVKGEGLGADEKPDYFSSKATVVMIKKENCMYMACPTEECNKKVVDMNNGRYRCEKCNQEYENYKWRLLIQACLCDFSDHQWVTCFQESAETLVGVSAEELGRLKETDENRFNDILSDANFKSYIFRLRIKLEMYNEESRFKATVVSAVPVDGKEYGHKLLNDIKQMEPLLV